MNDSARLAESICACTGMRTYSDLLVYGVATLLVVGVTISFAFIIGHEIMAKRIIKRGKP